MKGQKDLKLKNDTEREREKEGMTEGDIVAIMDDSCCQMVEYKPRNQELVGSGAGPFSIFSVVS